MDKPETLFARIIAELYPWTVYKCPSREEIAADLLGTGSFFGWQVTRGAKKIPLARADILSAKLKARAAVLESLARELDDYHAQNAHKTRGWKLKKSYRIAK
jgi:hypothetical protein